MLQSTFVIGDTPHFHKGHIYIYIYIYTHTYTYTVRQKANLASSLTSDPLYRKPFGASE